MPTASFILSLNPRVAGSLCFLVEGPSQEDFAVAASDSRSVFDANGNRIRARELTKHGFAVTSGPTQQVQTFSAKDDKKAKVMGIGLNTTLTLYLVTVFNMEELMKYTNDGMSTYLTTMIPVSIICVLISIIIGCVSHIPVKNVKVSLEKSGREVVNRYHELNANNTSRLQRENAVKFSTERAHGASANGIK